MSNNSLKTAQLIRAELCFNPDSGTPVFNGSAAQPEITSPERKQAQGLP